MKAPLAFALVSFLALGACVDHDPLTTEQQASLTDDSCEGLTDQAQDTIAVLGAAELRGDDVKAAQSAVIDAFQAFVDTDCSRRWSTAYQAIEPAAWDFWSMTQNTSASGCGTEARDDFKECQEECKAAGKKLCGCVAALVIDVVGCIPL